MGTTFQTHSVDGSPLPRPAERLARWLTPGRMLIYPAVFSLGVVAFMAGVLWVNAVQGRPPFQIVGRDFAAFYTAGRFLLEGRVSELYSFESQSAFQFEVFGTPSSDKWVPFLNPPFTAVMYAPFSLWGYEPGLLLWWTTGLLTLGIVMHLLRQELIPTRPRSLPDLFLLSLLFFPTLAWFFYGQSTPIVLLLYTLAFVMLRRKRDIVAGAAIGLLLFKPQLLMAIGIVMVAKRRWAALLGSTLTAGIWVGIGLAIHPESMAEYLRFTAWLPSLLRLEAYPSWGIHSFYAFATLMLDGISRRAADVLAVALTAGGVLGLVLVWRGAPWRPGSREWDFLMGGTFALGLLISPHMYYYDLMLLLLPLAIVWSRYPTGTRGRALDGGPLLAWTALLYLATFIGSFVTWAQLGLTVALGLPRMALQFSVPIIVGWVWLVIGTGIRPQERMDR